MTPARRRVRGTVGSRAIVDAGDHDPDIWGYTAYAETERLAPHWFRVVERD